MTPGPSDNEGTLTLQSPAKLNLALAVGAPDPNGYHPLASWMVATRFHDTLAITHADKPALDVRFTDDALGTHTVDWPAEADLTWRALHKLAEHTGCSLPLRVTLEKRIPPGGGLGGGSGNAATLLVAANQFLDLNLPDTDLHNIAATLGADVPFFIHALRGNPSCLATGYGEILTPTPLHQPIHLVLIWPRVGCPTGPVYRTFDELNPTAKANLQAVRDLINTDNLPPEAPFNDLAEPAMTVQPLLRSTRNQLCEQLSHPVHITGSGSTLYLIAPTAHQAEQTARDIRDNLPLDTIATQTQTTSG